MYVWICLFSATFKLPESVKWLKLNYRNTGFYIVHYGDRGWAALKDALSKNVSVLTQDDRASLIHNIFALSRYNTLQYKQFCIQWQDILKKESFFQFLCMTCKMLMSSPVAPTGWDVCPSFMCSTCWTTCLMKPRLPLWQRPCYNSTTSTGCLTKDRNSLWPAWRYGQTHILRLKAFVLVYLVWFYNIIFVIEVLIYLFVPCVVGLYFASFWFSDKRTNMERGGKCV